MHISPQLLNDLRISQNELSYLVQRALNIEEKDTVGQLHDFFQLLLNNQHNADLLESLNPSVTIFSLITDVLKIGKAGLRYVTDRGLRDLLQILIKPTIRSPNIYGKISFEACRLYENLLNAINHRYLTSESDDLFATIKKNASILYTLQAIQNTLIIRLVSYGIPKINYEDNSSGLNELKMGIEALRDNAVLDVNQIKNLLSDLNQLIYIFNYILKRKEKKDSPSPTYLSPTELNFCTEQFKEFINTDQLENIRLFLSSYFGILVSYGFVAEHPDQEISFQSYMDKLNSQQFAYNMEVVQKAIEIALPEAGEKCKKCFEIPNIQNTNEIDLVDNLPLEEDSSESSTHMSLDSSSSGSQIAHDLISPLDAETEIIIPTSHSPQKNARIYRILVFLQEIKQSYDIFISKWNTYKEQELKKINPIEEDQGLPKLSFQPSNNNEYSSGIPSRILDQVDILTRYLTERKKTAEAHTVRFQKYKESKFARINEFLVNIERYFAGETNTLPALLFDNPIAPEIYQNIINILNRYHQYYFYYKVIYRNSELKACQELIKKAKENLVLDPEYEQLANAAKTSLSKLNDAKKQLFPAYNELNTTFLLFKSELAEKIEEIQKNYADLSISAPKKPEEIKDWLRTQEIEHQAELETIKEHERQKNLESILSDLTGYDPLPDALSIEGYKNDYIGVIQFYIDEKTKLLQNKKEVDPLITKLSAKLDCAIARHQKHIEKINSLSSMLDEYTQIETELNQLKINIDSFEMPNFTATDPVSIKEKIKCFTEKFQKIDLNEREDDNNLIKEYKTQAGKINLLNLNNATEDMIAQWGAKHTDYFLNEFTAILNPDEARKNHIKDLISYLASHELISPNSLLNILSRIQNMDKPNHLTTNEFLIKQKSLAKWATELILPHCKNLSSLLNLSVLVEKKHSGDNNPYRFIRQERGFFRCQYGNTATWEYIITQIKQRICELNDTQFNPNNLKIEEYKPLKKIFLTQTKHTYGLFAWSKPDTTAINKKLSRNPVHIKF